MIEVTLTKLLISMSLTFISGFIFGMIYQDTKIERRFKK